MPFVLALAAAAAFGTADFVGGVASRRSSAILVTVLAQAGGASLLIPGLLLTRSPFSLDGVLWGAAAGVAGGLGLVIFFRALARGTMSMVSPLTAVFAGGIAVLAGLLLGESIGAASWVGIACGLVAVFLIGWVRGHGAGTGLGAQVAMALAAGAGFGCFFVALAQTPASSGLWPLAGARVASFSVLFAVLLLSRGAVAQAGAAIRLGVISGMLDMGANILYLLAVRQGDLAIIAVLASLYPAATLLLSFRLLGERLRWHQLAGVGLALASVALIAAG
ncbi:MAG TPA: DMT family transporter [Candidatus Dormibacteraeota bacterium]|nr:DMT family transporter [Candidatus Dormibacteraeota bacterium]